MSMVCTVFRECVRAMRGGILIEQESRRDKEFHFQNWIKLRLENIGENYDEPGRNTYPDFRFVHHAEGYEVKGLSYPGRDADYDCNSQVPCGEHNGRQVFYVFGRYPARTDGEEYPVLDLVICHGSFLNAESMYAHQNKGFRVFGSYGDIRVRDRKMYVAPTLFALASGTAHHRTLILPANMTVDSDFVEIGHLTRYEVDHIVVAYNFDLRTNDLTTSFIPNPTAGVEHAFKAYCLEGDPSGPIVLRERSREIAEREFQNQSATRV